METQKTHLSIRIIYWFTMVVFWIFAVFAIILLGVSVAFLFGWFDDGLFLNVGLPVAFDLRGNGTLDLGFLQSEVALKEAYGKIQFPGTPAYIARIYGAFMLVIIPVIFSLIYLFRNFIRNVYRGMYFEVDNIIILKRISYVLMGLWFLMVAYSVFQYFFLAINLTFENVDFTGNLQFHGYVFFSGLFLWMLSHIFLQGAKLQEDNNLTI